MRILFASGFQHLPQMYGGLMSNTHELALELSKRGHEVSVVCGLSKDGLIGLQTRLLNRFGKRNTVHDDFLGYRVYRRWRALEALGEVVACAKPDVAIVQQSDAVRIARELNRLSVPAIMYLHDVNFDLVSEPLGELDDVDFVANSEFTRRRYRERFGIESSVIPPFFRDELYRTPTRPEAVTFINPQQVKGSDIALALVQACAEIPFNFVESWALPREQRALLLAQVKARPNLRLSRPTMNVKRFYSRSSIVLAPSRCEEAWGRVASEAQFSGIPVVGSNRGGLPEAIGAGGILLDPDGPIDAWVDALRKLWHDRSHHDELSAAALAHSSRPEINPDVQVSALMRLISGAVGRPALVTA
jgi:glycosyltransferase involved in cell wall biosynthesis